MKVRLYISPTKQKKINHTASQLEKVYSTTHIDYIKELSLHGFPVKNITNIQSN